MIQIGEIDPMQIAKVGTWTFDVKSKKMKWSSQMYNIFPDNIDDGEPELDEHIKTIHPEDFEHWQQTVEKCISDGQAYFMFFRAIHPENKTVWVMARGQGQRNSKGKIIALFGTCQDVTDLKAKEYELKELNEYFNFALEGANLGIWDWNLRSDTVQFDRRWAEMLGLKHHETVMEFSTWESRVHPEDLSQCYSDIRKYMNGQTPYYENIHRMKHERGDWIYVLERGRFSEWDTDGVPVRFTGTHLDITETKLQELELRKQKDFLRDTVDNLPAVFYAKDIEGRFVSVNKAFRTLFEWENKNVIGKTNHDLFSKDLADQFRKNDLEIIEKDRVIESEEVVLDASGAKKIYHSYKFPYHDSEGIVCATGGISLDITDKKELEQKALHNSKMASIGLMAAGVGHEINNPLAIALGYIESLKMDLKSESLDLLNASNKLDKALIASRRIAEIVNGLRSFARVNENLDGEKFDLAKVIKESVDLVREIYLREGVKVSVLGDLDSASYEVFGSKGKIQQVF